MPAELAARAKRGTGILPELSTNAVHALHHVYLHEEELGFTPLSEIHASIVEHLHSKKLLGMPKIEGAKRVWYAQEGRKALSELRENGLVFGGSGENPHLSLNEEKIGEIKTLLKEHGLKLTKKA